MNVQPPFYVLGVCCPHEKAISAALMSIDTKELEGVFQAESLDGLGSLVKDFLGWIERLSHKKITFVLVTRNFDMDAFPINSALRCINHGGLRFLKGNINPDVIILDSFYRGAAELSIEDNSGNVETVAFRQRSIGHMLHANPYIGSSGHDPVCSMTWKACCYFKHLQDYTKGYEVVTRPVVSASSDPVSLPENADLEKNPRRPLTPIGEEYVNINPNPWWPWNW